MTMEKTARKLTVSYTHRATQTDFVEIPAIRLKGKWLEQFGFVQGKKIMVETSERKLVITLIDEAKEYAPNIRLKQLGPTG